MTLAVGSGFDQKDLFPIIKKHFVFKLLKKNNGNDTKFFLLKGVRA